MLGGSISKVEIGLDELGVAPLDLLSLPEAGVPQELDDRIRRAVLQKPAAGATQAVVVAERDPSWKPQVIALTEFLALLQAVSRMVNSARPLPPSDLVVQGDPPAAVAATELQSRADAAEKQMRATLASLQAPSANDASLLAAAASGIAGAIPGGDSSKWPAQIAAAAADLTTRASQLTQLAAAFTRASATAEQSSDYDASRMKTIFGGSFQVLPVLTPSGGNVWQNSLNLQGNDPLESVRWFQRAARVRPGAARLDVRSCWRRHSPDVCCCASTWRTPCGSGRRWVALPGSTSSSRLSLVAFSPAASDRRSGIAGLMIDEWTEVLPSVATDHRGVVPVRRPGRAAPQSILLAVKPDDFPGMDDGSGGRLGARSVGSGEDPRGGSRSLEQPWDTTSRPLLSPTTPEARESEKQSATDFNPS